MVSCVRTAPGNRGRSHFWRRFKPSFVEALSGSRKRLRRGGSSAILALRAFARARMEPV